MNSRLKIPSRTPTEPSYIEILASSSTNIYFGAHPARDSVTTLVGDLPPPHSSEAKSPQSISSQRATSSRETPDPAPRPYPVTPTISARRRPVCKTCGTPRKGHKRGTCTPCPTPPDERKSLYVSSPESERTPTKASAFVEALAKSLKTTPTPSTSTISSVITAISASGKRRPIHGTCGLPMKGHKRQNGALICPSDHNQDPMSSLRTKAPKGMDQNPDFLDSPSDRRPHKDHSDSVNYIHGRDTTPISTSAYTRSSNAQIKRVVHVSPTGDRCRSESPNPFVSSDSLDNSIFAPSIASGSQSTVIMPSISALNDALGEPALAIYPAWNRDEVSRIREQAKASHFFNGVVNVKIEEKDGLDLTRAINKGDADDHEVPSSHYMKWVIVSREKEMVQKCIDLCAERSLEL
ncbi:hypothetical protein JOM56_008920 [Amanita muscaria]